MPSSLHPCSVAWRATGRWQAPCLPAGRMPASGVWTFSCHAMSFFLGAGPQFPNRPHREALRACLDAKGVIKYQPRATPWVYRPKAILSAEGAIHSHDGSNRVPTPRRDLSRSGQMERMRQAVGLQEDRTTRKPRALPWAGISQAFGLRARDVIGCPNE